MYICFMKTNFLLFVFFGLTVFSYGQKDSLNQRDSLGKKDGTWIEYLDAKWKVLKDSSHAVYAAYNYYDHGENTFRVAFNGVHRLRHKLEYAGNNNPQNGRIKILDGEYKWLDKKGRVVTIDSFKNGEHVFVKYFFGERAGGLLGFKKKFTGKLGGYYDFTKTYKGQPHTYYMETYDKNGIVTHYYTRKGKYGWLAYYYAE